MKNPICVCWRAHTTNFCVCIFQCVESVCVCCFCTPFSGVSWHMWEMVFCTLAARVCRGCLWIEIRHVLPPACSTNISTAPKCVSRREVTAGHTRPETALSHWPFRWHLYAHPKWLNLWIALIIAPSSWLPKRAHLDYVTSYLMKKARGFSACVYT